MAVWIFNVYLKAHLSRSQYELLTMGWMISSG